MLKKLRRKFIFINMSLVFFVLTAVLAVGLISMAVHFKNEYTFALDREMTDSAKGGRNRIFRMGMPKDDPFGRAAKLSFSAVQAESGAWVLATPWIQVEEETLQALCGRALSARDASGFWADSGIAFCRAEGRIAFVNLQSEYAQLRNFFLVWPLGYLAAMGVFFVLSLLFARWALRPVEEAWQRQRRFVSDASHELKTPLTVILANLDIAQRERASTWLSAAETEALRMKRLIGDMLFLAKSDEGAAQKTDAPADLSAIADETALAFEAGAFENAQQLHTAVAPDIWVSGDAGLLRQMAGILMDNAVKYTPRGGSITMRLEKTGDKAVLSVHNTGEAIPPEKLNHLFDRFYRLDDARAEGGYGLGLAIAQQIAFQHGGTLKAESSAKQGTVFTVTLPVMRAEKNSK